MKRRNGESVKLIRLKIHAERQIGITDLSLKYLKRLLSGYKNLEVISLTVSSYGPYSFQVFGMAGGDLVFILLSGLNCGYRGTGPHGTVKALEMLGVPLNGETEEMIYTRRLCHYHSRGGWEFHG